MSHPLEHLTWRRSSYCGTGACVETAGAGPLVYVRDAARSVVAVPRAEWTAFVDGVKSGQIRRPGR